MVICLRYEDSILNYEKIVQEIKKYGKSLSEADTRCKIIDKIIVECLGWDELDIRREEHVNRGYIDYVMRVNGSGLIVEAKKIEIGFELPAGIDNSSRLTIGRLLNREKNIDQHYNQVLKYCLDAGIPFGCFTNGLEWVVFPAIRTDGVQHHMSRVIVFKGLEEIGKNFVTFWNVLSKEAVRTRTTNSVLLTETKPIPISYVINDRYRRHEVLNRNTLATVLSPILPEYFGDLAGWDTLDRLKSCYVEGAPWSEATKDKRELSKEIGVSPPVMQYESNLEVSASLERTIDAFTKTRGKSGVLYVILGRIGSGKSTFLYHFFFVSHKSLLDKNLVYYINWLEYDGQVPISEFFYDKIEEISKRSPIFVESSKYEHLEKIFQEDIVPLKKGPLGGVEDKHIISTNIANLLMDINRKKSYYYTRIFDYLRKNKNIHSLLIFDNIDQLQPEMQEEIIKFAFSAYQRWRSFVLLSMREENYAKSKRDGSLSTIQCNRVHLPRTSVIPIIEKRLQCFADEAATNHLLTSYLQDTKLTNLDIKQYIQLVIRSLTSSQDRVKNFLEAIALGNIREALEFFRSFLTAGNTNSAKIIEIMKKSGEYLIPDHEFIKSISLGSRKYFSEGDSPILNLFGITDMESPSHFTRLRILYILDLFKYQSKPIGTGYEDISRIVHLLKSIGLSENDIRGSILVLTKKGLIENELLSQKYLDQATAVRITPTGSYYLNYLCHQFVYLDLMQQDTPIFDEETFSELNRYVESTEIPDRFKRCDAFVKYLHTQENNETLTIGKITEEPLLNSRFIPKISQEFAKNKSKIQAKLDRYLKDKVSGETPN